MKYTRKFPCIEKRQQFYFKESVFMTFISCSIAFQNTIHIAKKLQYRTNRYRSNNFANPSNFSLNSLTVGYVQFCFEGGEGVYRI